MSLGAILVTVLLQGVGGAGPDPVLRRAVADFERTRWWHLPAAGRGSRSRCDARVGEWCYWYDSLATSPPPEAAEVQGAREALLVELGAAALRAPDDPWLHGQRVRYLLEAGRPEDAIGVVHPCAGDDAWCSALEGLAHHTRRDLVAADSSFSRALRLMPPSERCLWLDLGPLLPAPAARRWRGLSCAERAADAERWLELGRPLLVQGGNAARTEFLSRQALIRIGEAGAMVDGRRISPSQRELALRYGWPIGWSRVGTGRSREDPIIAHDPVPAWWVLPSALERPQWRVASARPPARFPVPRVSALYDLDDAQLARLPRGRETLVIAAWRLSDRSPLNIDGLSGVLGVKRRDLPPEVAARMVAGGGGVVAARVAGEVESAGIELLHPDGATWIRHRAAWNDRWPPTGGILSDLVLFDPAPGSAETIEELLPQVLRTPGVRRGGSMGVYWEWTDLPIADSGQEFRISVRREGEARPRLTWSWPLRRAPSSQGAGSMVLDLSRLGRGRYELDLALTGGSRELRTSRAFQVH